MSERLIVEDFIKNPKCAFNHTSETLFCYTMFLYLIVQCVPKICCYEN